MRKPTPQIEWIGQDVLSLTVMSGSSWLALLDAVETLSELNLSSRPVNYLIRLDGRASFADGGRADNLAEFFLRFIPARTALAVIHKTEFSGGAAEFLSRLAAAGYQVATFSGTTPALAWLRRNPTRCQVRGLSCSPDCPEAYSPTCPAIGAAYRETTPVVPADKVPPGHKDTG
ncbi:hypothetical protein [Maricaulis sp.]|uniref:hypothetical protein n=1 Tax=Maricaulis sp. TaxID=1486257 RepID=UPI00260649F8|nr:hypothetical protein [Maricaulis sp.]